MSTISPTIQNEAADVSPVDALWVLIQSQTKAVRKSLIKRLLEEDSAAANVQKKKVKESLTKAFDELNSGQAKHNARNLFSE